MHLDSTSIARFWSKVDRSGGPDACWLWQAACTKAGYGVFGTRRFGPQLSYAHHLAYTLSSGAIPDGLQVLHNCPEGDNPRCVNPAHLWIGTQGDNMRDMWAKGRQGAGRFTNPARGHQLPHTKLTEAAVLDIRSRSATGSASYGVLAAEYAVSIGTIAQVVTRRSWKHVA